MNYQEKIARLREEEIECCRKDIDYFIDKYGHIEDKDATDLIQPFRLWKAQRDALHSIMDHRWNIILKARQLGFSWLVMHIAAHMMLSPGKTIVGLSRTEEEAKELVRRLKVIFTYMPELVADKDYLPEGWKGMIFDGTALTVKMVFPDGQESKFQAFPSSPGVGRSFTVNLIILDEWAFQQFAREIWQAGFPTINRPGGGKVIGLSTIDRGTLFEEKFNDPDSGFNKIFIPWYADPRRDEEWYKKTKLALGDLIYAEYPATVDEAMMVPGGAFFPEVKSATHVTKEELKGEVRRYCTIDYGLDCLAAIWIAVDVFGNEQGYRYVEEPNLTVKQAAETILSRSAFEKIDAYLAPDDLWNRRQETGKSAATIFGENDVYLTKVNRDLHHGCIATKEHLQLREDGTPQLTFLEGTCDKLIDRLKKIQKDKNKPSVYSKTPHELTHGPDALRGFCTWWVSPAREKGKDRKEKRWSADMLEDWDNANEELRAMMRERYGEPIR